jgi:hypothetical protein
MAVGQPAVQLVMLSAQDAVAGVEQHQLFAGVHNGWNERMLKAVGIDVVGAGQFLHGLPMDVIYFCRSYLRHIRPAGTESRPQHLSSDLQTTGVHATLEHTPRGVPHRMTPSAGFIRASKC